jgi:hypothetical protein
MNKRNSQWGQFQFEEPLQKVSKFKYTATFESKMMDIDESGYGSQKKESNITNFTEPNPIYDFSIIDRKIEEIYAILEELYKLKEHFEQVAPKERGFCSYLA